LLLFLFSPEPLFPMPLIAARDSNCRPKAGSTS
jgi:hypothetical protein